jgi:putative acetyltransferase
MEIKAETESDRAAIRDVQVAAFPTLAEADLVDKLRNAGDVVFSLAAVVDGRIVGHVLFSRMREPKGFLGLAPVAVVSSHRRRGIADKLIRDGLERARLAGWSGVFVLGDDYYQRFGFTQSLAVGFASPYAGPHLMALSLQPGGLPVRSGRAEYPQAFSELE